MELTLNSRLTPFDLENTLQCGQLFRWEKHGDWWLGIVGNRVLKVKQVDNALKFEGVDTDFVRSYFRLDDNLPQIISEISQDSLIEQSVQTFFGLRIVRQNPWECLISYICATYKNIPAIKNMISELSKRLGERASFEAHEFHVFPGPDKLAEASLNELRRCRLGFRAKRVREAARMVTCNEIDFEALRKLDYETAKDELLPLPGVGNKVADCVLLFSLEKLEAFPVDVWMKRVVQQHYRSHFDEAFIKKISERRTLPRKHYDRIGSFARSYFGRYAGYAQEYLFHFVRSKNSRDQA